MIKAISVLFVILGASAAGASSAASAYSAVACGITETELENRIEQSLSVHKEALARRMTLAGFKGEKLSKILDVSIECANSNKKSYERSDRIVVQAFFQINDNICRFQFSDDENDEIFVLSFEYMHCALIRK